MVLETPWLSAALLERRISHYDDTGLLGAVCETNIPLMNSICLQDRFFVSGAAVVLLTSKRGAGVQKHACIGLVREPHTGAGWLLFYSSRFGPDAEKPETLVSTSLCD